MAPPTHVAPGISVQRLSRLRASLTSTETHYAEEKAVTGRSPFTPARAPGRKRRQDFALRLAERRAATRTVVAAPRDLGAFLIDPAVDTTLLRCCLAGGGGLCDRAAGHRLSRGAAEVPAVEARRPHRPGEMINPRAAPSALEIQPELLFVPLAAFDRRGHRIDSAPAIYDRHAQRSSGSRARSTQESEIRLFSVSEIDRAPDEAHDEPLDCILTESELIFPQSAAR